MIPKHMQKLVVLDCESEEEEEEEEEQVSQEQN